MFAVNMLLKISIDSSGTYMWCLIHTLQIFRYLLLINFKSTTLLDTFVKYLAITVGEVNELEDLLPNWFTEYIINLEDLDNHFIHRKFNESGKN